MGNSLRSAGVKRIEEDTSKSFLRQAVGLGVKESGCLDYFVGLGVAGGVKVNAAHCGADAFNPFGRGMPRSAMRQYAVLVAHFSFRLRSDAKIEVA